MPYRSALLLSALVLCLAGTSTPAGAASQRPARHQPTAAASASVEAGAASNMLQATSHIGDPGYRISNGGISRFHPSTASRMAIFRGGAHSKPNTTSGGKRAPATSSGTSTPKIALYNNLNSPGMPATVDPFQTTPSDSNGAIGPSHYVEINNAAIAAYNRSNLSSVATITLDNFIGGFSLNFCDPQVQWDPTANRFFASWLYCNLNDPQQAFFFAWSKTSDPSNLLANNFNAGPNTGGWCSFVFFTSSNLFDYVKLGHNARYLIFGGNYYSENPPGNTNPPFVTSQILWIPKPGNLDTSCTLPASYGFTPQNPLKNADGTSITYTPVPVNTMTSATDGYIVSAFDPSGSNNQAPGPRSKLAVWHLDNNGVIHQHPDLAVNTFDVPSSAPQSGTGNTLDTLDGRLTQAVGDPTSGIWTQQTVNGPGGRSAANWYEIRVAGGVASIAQEGQVASPTDFVFNAAISPQSSGAGGAAIFYTRSSSSHDPLIAAEIRHASTALNTMEPNELVIATSTDNAHDFSCTPCRWGDYSGASPDPNVSDVVWGTNTTVQTGGGPTQPEWADQNFAVQLVASPPNPPVSVNAVAGSGSATVTWPTAAFDSLAPVTGYTVKAYQGVTLIGSKAASASAHSLVFTGLTNGTTYTFTVTALSTPGPSAESLHSNPVTPTRAVTSTAAHTPPARGVNPAPPPPSVPPR